jgi:hypothetical protein
MVDVFDLTLLLLEFFDFLGEKLNQFANDMLAIAVVRHALRAESFLYFHIKQSIKTSTSMACV